MWEPWRPGRLAADLRRLRSLNANTVRIVVAPSFFGYPEPEQKYVDRLGELVALAAAAGPPRAADALRLVGRLRRPRRLEAVGGSAARAVRRRPDAGVRRAPERDRRRRTQAAVAWARALVPWLRTLLGRGTPVTLSVAGMDPLADLRALAGSLPAGVTARLLQRALLHGRRESARPTSSAASAPPRRRRRSGSASSAIRPRRRSRASRACR